MRGCILCIPRCVESRIAGSRRGEEPSGEIFLRLIQIRLAKSSLEKIRQPVKAKVTGLKFFSRSHDAVIRRPASFASRECSSFAGLPSCRLLRDTSLYGARNRRQIAV